MIIEVNKKVSIIGYDEKGDDKFVIVLEKQSNYSIIGDVEVNLNEFSGEVMTNISIEDMELLEIFNDSYDEIMERFKQYIAFGVEKEEIINVEIYDIKINEERKIAEAEVYFDTNKKEMNEVNIEIEYHNEDVNVYCNNYEDGKTDNYYLNVDFLDNKAVERVRMRLEEEGIL